MEHPYRPARVSRGVEFYRGATAPGRARVGVSSLRQPPRAFRYGR